MGQANVTLFILSMILMLASITLLLILFFIPIFTKRFSNPFARIHINLLLVFLIFINLIELTLFIVDFYILTKQDLLPKMYYEVAGPLIHIIILVLLILSFLFVFVTYLERFAISFKISNSIEISIHLITIVLPVVIVIFNIICFGEMVYLEIFKTSIGSLSENAKSFVITNLFLFSVFIAMDLIFFLSLVVNVYCCSRKVFQQEIFTRIQFLVKYNSIYFPLLLSSWVLLKFAFQDSENEETFQLSFVIMNLSSSTSLLFIMLHNGERLCTGHRSSVTFDVLQETKL